MRRSNPLDGVLARSGATMIEREGALVAADFGSVAGELAVCQRAAGIADRADLAQLELHGEPERVTEALVTVAGREPAPGVAAHGRDAWWCRLDAHRVLGVGEPGHTAAAVGALEAAAGTIELSWSDVSDEHVALGLAGPAAAALLEAAGPIAAGDLPGVGGFDDVTLGGTRALLLREAPALFLLLVPAAQGVRAWHALHEAGAALGAGAVGFEAFDRFAASQRALARQTAQPA